MLSKVRLQIVAFFYLKNLPILNNAAIKEQDSNFYNYFFKRNL